MNYLRDLLSSAFIYFVIASRHECLLGIVNSKQNGNAYKDIEEGQGDDKVCVIYAVCFRETMQFLPYSPRIDRFMMPLDFHSFDDVFFSKSSKQIMSGHE